MPGFGGESVGSGQPQDDGQDKLELAVVGDKEQEQVESTPGARYVELFYSPLSEAAKSLPTEIPSDLKEQYLQSKVVQKYHGQGERRGKYSSGDLIDNIWRNVALGIWDYRILGQGETAESRQGKHSAARDFKKWLDSGQPDEHLFSHYYSNYYMAIGWGSHKDNVGSFKWPVNEVLLDTARSTEDVARALKEDIDDRLLVTSRLEEWIATHKIQPEFSSELKNQIRLSLDKAVKSLKDVIRSSFAESLEGKGANRRSNIKDFQEKLVEAMADPATLEALHDLVEGTERLYNVPGELGFYLITNCPHDFIKRNEYWKAVLDSISLSLTPEQNSVLRLLAYQGDEINAGRNMGINYIASNIPETILKEVRIDSRTLALLGIESTDSNSSE